MGRIIFQDQLPVYEGEFSWHEPTLQAKIKTFKADYNPDDPKTWVVISSETLRNSLGYEYDGMSLLPSHAAYDRELVMLCTSYFADKPVMVNDGQLQDYFYRFPYVYDQSGMVRLNECITAEDCSLWIKAFSGRPTGGIVKTESPERDNPGSTLEPPKDTMNMLREMKSDIFAKIKALQKETGVPEHKLTAEKKRADAAERQLTKVLRREEALKRECESLKQNYERQLVDRQAGLLIAERLVSQRDAELEVAREQARAVEKEVSKIRDELRELSGDGTRKRKATDEMPGSRSKRA